MLKLAPLLSASLVALLAEGVDRNYQVWVIDPLWMVALLAEGVDRNSSILQVHF